MHQYRLRERLEHGTPSRPWHLYTLGNSQGTVFPCHWHPDWECLLVERGSMVLTRNHEVLPLEEGDAAFLTGSDLHGGTSHDSQLIVHALVLQTPPFHGDHRDPATQTWVVPLEAGALRGRGRLPRGSRAARLVAELVDTTKGKVAGAELLVKGLVFQLLHELVCQGLLEASDEPVTSPVSRVRDLLQFIEEHFAEDLTVETLADRACLSASHFSRVFRALTGESPIRHLIHRRLEEAARRLRQTDAGVSEVAFQVGFSNFSHFSRTFRAYWKCSPTAYRHGNLP